MNAIPNINILSQDMTQLLFLAIFRSYFNIIIRQTNFSVHKSYKPILNIPSVNKKEHIYEAVKNNSKILKSSKDQLLLCYLESFMIQKYKCKINIGIKASKELQLF